MTDSRPISTPSTTTERTSASLAIQWNSVERQFRERDSSLFFVLPRVLRRVLRNELEISSPWVRIPHRKSYVIPRDRLLWLVATDELGIESASQVPDRAILLARPEEDRLQKFDLEGLQRYYWRLAYHAKIDAVMSERTSPGQMTPAQLRYRIDRLGQEQFDEIRVVLRQEHFLTNPQNMRHVYAEFVAVFSELRAFAPDLVPLYFPALPRPEAVEQVIREDCDTQRLLNGLRPRDLAKPIAEPVAAPTLPLDASLSTAELPASAGGGTPSKWRFRWLSRRAARLNERGNTMRAALLRTRARQYAPLLQLEENDELLAADLANVAQRLQQALELDAAEAARWQHICGRLLEFAAVGFWNANARLLYDLQKVCIDHERDVYKVDLARWLVSFGKRPLRRPLPDMKLVLMAKHLRTATGRIGSVRLSDADRRELDTLLHHAAHRAEELLRRLLEPQISEALHEVGLVPQNQVELTAFRKLLAELVDGVVERGFITLGHLRDAVSRGHLKLTDLSSVREFFAGDALLRADRRLAVALDGVYQRGPFYLRWMQRMTSLFFGTPPGRFITQYFALPFGAAFVGLKGIELLAEEAHHLIETPQLHIYSHELMFGIGVFLLGLIHWPEFRSGVWLIVRSTWLLLRGVILDLPRFLYRLPGVATLLRSLPVLLFRRYLLTPLALTLIVWKGLPALGLYDEWNPWVGVAVLVLSFLALNSRMGRDSEELFWEYLGRLWHRFRVTVIIGLFNLIVDLFRQVMDALERLLYGVDEWLRFRTGESRISLGVKAVLGMIWGFVQGVIRFCVTLLIEPQLNPIKHFPVVTVSHKLILPSVFYISSLFTAFTDPITAKAIATTIVTCIPGVFGFLAWELKENWRVYAANRSPVLKPVLVGHHGETILRLLTPGFHSGTIPKLFARRRRAARKAQHHPEFSRHSRYDEKLHHEAAAIQHFVERDFLNLLRRSRHLGELPLEVSAVDLSTNRITIQVARGVGGAPLKLTFAEQSGWLIAGMLEPGWVRELTPGQQQVLAVALAGLYHQSAVDLVRQQIESQLGSPPHPYDIAEAGLIVWPTRSYDAEVTYNLEDRPLVTPRPRSVARVAGLEPRATGALVFKEHPLSWEQWREFWEAELTHPEVPPSPLDPGLMLIGR